jgi:putative endonuclease
VAGLDRRKRAGNYGETAAEGYLAAKGYAILARNYRAWGGEIDIIAKDGDYIVFIEVKYRRQTAYGRPVAAITQKKRRAMVAAAYGYLADNGRGDENCRFDIIEVFGREQLDINHIENAFGES